MHSLILHPSLILIPNSKSSNIPWPNSKTSNIEGVRERVECLLLLGWLQRRRKRNRSNGTSDLKKKLSYQSTAVISNESEFEQHFRSRAANHKLGRTISSHVTQRTMDRGKKNHTPTINLALRTGPWT
jgi:hypothetical protein